MAPIDVLPLADAKRFLNIRTAEFDDELTQDFIGPAVERVERHLAGEAGIGQTLTTAAAATQLQILAVKAVLADYWRTQRTRVGGRSYGGGTTAAAVEADSGPTGAASLRSRLTDLLGPPFEGSGSAPPAPGGSFPKAQPWPDPPFMTRST